MVPVTAVAAGRDGVRGWGNGTDRRGGGREPGDDKLGRERGTRAQGVPQARPQAIPGLGRDLRAAEVEAEHDRRVCHRRPFPGAAIAPVPNFVRRVS